MKPYSADLRSLTSQLETFEGCSDVTEYFLKRSIDEVRSTDDGSELRYSGFYQLFLPGVVRSNIEHIYQHGGSPIEKIFFASLQLLFIRSQVPCLHFWGASENAEATIAAYREKHLAIMRWIDSYREATGDQELARFDLALNEKVEKGQMTAEDVTEVSIHQHLIANFEWNGVHAMMQAGLPGIKVNSRSIRCDLLIWVPGDESVKIVIECDGFAWHSSKESFVSDRARDRQLQLNGYRVIRFSGSEINEDPSRVASELFDLLQAINPEII
ncbi:endonuclease domain-containing protein [Mucilaginibacter sp.]|uniref:endonuclease domain-containing protein n=1 Tax=Mucilaginibacter sp. TaxID=1882438 RepID=UPI0035BC4B1C